MVRKQRPTQADVARLAGVSQATVSNVLNAKESLTITPETRQRILDAARQLDYLPDRTARNLRAQRTFTIAVIIPDITNPYHPAFVRGIQDVALRCGYEVIIYNTDNREEQEREAIKSALQYHVDGLIGILFHVGVEDCRQLLDRGIEVVVNLPEIISCDLPIGILVLDNEAAGQTAVQHLVDRGHTRIGYIDGIADEPPSLIRRRAYRQVLAQSGIEPDPGLAAQGDFTYGGGYRAMQSLLAAPQPPTAIFAANDLMAVGAMHAVLDGGLRVPEDVAVVGFDDIALATMVRPRLTTIGTFQDRIGSRAAELLIELINQPGPGRPIVEQMPFQLIVRDSA